MRFVLPALSGTLCLLLAACHAAQPDWCVALTIWPPWLWLLSGLLLARLGWAKETKRTATCIMLLWAAFVLVFCEEPRSLARELVPREQPGSRFRVVSLNCAGGSAAAAGEAAAVQPDLVLLQETPTRTDVRRLAERLWGPGAGMVWGFDTSIICRTAVQVEGLPRGTSHFGAGRVELPGIGETEVVSLRLTPPVVRFDLWSPTCWRDYRENREARRERLREVVQFLAALPPERPVILGGDFNAPAGDAIFRLLHPRLRDSFAEAGRG